MHITWISSTFDRHVKKVPTRSIPPGRTLFTYYTTQNNIPDHFSSTFARTSPAESQINTRASTPTFTFVFCFKNLVILEIGFGIFGLGILSAPGCLRRVLKSRGRPLAAPLLSFSRSRDSLTLCFYTRITLCARSTGAKFLPGETKSNRRRATAE